MRSNDRYCRADATWTPSRRHLIGISAASLALWAFRPGRVLGLGRADPRFLVIVLRGGLDGLSMIAPVGDPDYARLRGPLALPGEGGRSGARLDTLFSLNRNMPFLAELYQRRQALAVHALASPYRGRSHFDGQDVLESGLAGVGRVNDGWLNRALSEVPAGERAGPRKGLAMGAVVPLVMRGGAPVLSWIPPTSGLPLRASTMARLTDLYGQTDPKLAKAFADGLAIDTVAGGGALASSPGKRPAAGQAPTSRPFREFIDTADAAAKFLSANDGPRIGALSFNGWDTHANEGVLDGQLGNRLAGLDQAIKALHDGLGATWAETVVLVVTEFGRTARPNGTAGTDHGTGTVALALGGRVKGGRVIADWPGLADAALFEGRDLKPTVDLRAITKGLLRDHLGIEAARLAAHVFPDSAHVAPMAGLIV